MLVLFKAVVGMYEYLHSNLSNIDSLYEYVQH